MYSEEDLDTAVTAGILTPEAVGALRRHVSALRQSPAVDEEHFRLLNSFNDVFVVVACMLLLVSVGWIASSISRLLGASVVSIVAWLLAEYFTRKRRMALPSIVLFAVFVGGIATAGMTQEALAAFAWIGIPALGACAAWCHWCRFKVPIAVATGVAAITGAVLMLFLRAFPDALQFQLLLPAVAGLFILTIAIAWDSKDRLRLTDKSDVAFWLHLLSAPLLVHPIFTLLESSSAGTSEQHSMALAALAILALYIAIALVSLALDRRALMVSALAYVLYTFSNLLKVYGVVSLSFAVTALFIGSALLLLSAFWHSSRRAVLRRLPRSIQAFLPA